jgi:hypothetical protein
MVAPGHSICGKGGRLSTDLRQLLTRLGDDPAYLEEWRRDPDAVLKNVSLEPGEKQVLLTGDAAALRQLLAADNTEMIPSQIEIVVAVYVA